MSPEERDRYSRQIRFQEVGEAGQHRLLDSTVVIAGCGALGSFQAAALARAGVGRLILIDRDYVEWSNLQRQWLFEESDAREGLPKAMAAARAIARINSSIEVQPQVADLTPGNIAELCAGADFILDGTDNFETRYLINDYCVSASVPWVYGAAVASYGLVMPVLPPRSACLKCVFPEAPKGAQASCETAGVLNTITSVIAAFQVSAALRVLVEGIDAVPARITTVDVWTGVVRQLAEPAREASCQACGRREFVHLENKRRVPISLCGRNAVQIHERQRPIDLAQLAAVLRPLGNVKQNEFALRFFLPEYEMTVFPDGRAIIKGTTDPGLARSLYARYIGA